MPTVYKKHTPKIIFLDAAPVKRYTLPTIHDLPKEDKPREKMERFGATALSTPELLAVMLSVGTTKEDVLSMSARIMKEYGERSIMSATKPEALVEDLGIPHGKAMQIVACAELGRRFYKRNDSALPTIRTVADVYSYVKDMHDLPKEHLRGIYLNAHYKVIHDEIISIGTVDTSIIHPREVFKPALEFAAAAIILVHNHPSGLTDSSDADISITQQIIQAGSLLGIELIDHVIVTKSGFASVPADYA
jgi:DNA repair protein RadC